MRTKTFLGEEIVLSEKEYKILLRRYDLRRARKMKDGFGNPFFIIDENCICCLYEKEDQEGFGMSPDCERCPLNINSETHGCNRIIEEIIGEYQTPSFFYEKMEWEIEENEEARKNIRKIRKVLKSMKRGRR